MLLVSDVYNVLLNPLRVSMCIAGIVTTSTSNILRR